MSKKIPILIVLIALFFLLSFCILKMPTFGDIHNPSYNTTTQYYIENTVEDVNIPNIVAAIITDYRAFDTLGETTVLFASIAAVISVLSIGSHKNKKEKEEKEEKEDGHLIVKTITRLIIPYIQLYGFFIIIHGHLSPGGGFSGGAVLGSSIILLTLSFSMKTASKQISHKVSQMIETTGLLWFIALGLIGIVLGNVFLSNKEAGIFLGKFGEVMSGGVIPLITIGIGMKVASTMVTLFHTIIKED